MFETIYERRDSEGCLEQRVNDKHPALGKYIVRASRLLYVKSDANNCCHGLNKMVEARESGKITDCALRIQEPLFRVVNYKGSHQTWVVVRKLLANDLVSGMDEMVEVKQR